MIIITKREKELKIWVNALMIFSLKQITPKNKIFDKMKKIVKENGK